MQNISLKILIWFILTVLMIFHGCSGDSPEEPSSAVHAPALKIPVNGSTINQDPPEFIWEGLYGAAEYQVIVDNADDFLVPLIDAKVKEKSFSPSLVMGDSISLGDGKYYWRVRAKDSKGTWGNWSAAWSFTISLQGPAAPVPIVPSYNANYTKNYPIFLWSNPQRAVDYELQIDNSPAFNELEAHVFADVCIKDSLVADTCFYYQATSSLLNGTYYWRVRARDEKWVWGTWSTSMKFLLNIKSREILDFPFPSHTSADSIPMVRITAGSLLMGASFDDPDAWSDEQPEHPVTIKKSFWIGRYELTQKQWRDVTGENPSYFKNLNRPVEFISWDDVEAFLAELNSLGNGVWRLPTEAEWEYVCRAGSTTRFYWGDDPKYEDIGDYSWYAGNSLLLTTQKGGEKNSNPWGLHDLAGNVWEWCSDYYHEDYSGAPDDGSSWELPQGEYRVARGGSFKSFAGCLRSAKRGGFKQDTASNNIGVRLIRDEM